MNDPDQNSTYDAEDLVTGWLDAASPDTGEVEVVVDRGGRRRTVVFRPEPEPRFSRPEDVRAFVERVMARLRAQAREFGSNYRGREQRAVGVQAYRGWTKAVYRDGTILLPARERGGAWALRGLVVLHELAHHLNTGVDGTIIDQHGEGFRTTFVHLLEDLGWVETAAMLREAHRQLGLDHEAGADTGMLAKVGKLLRHAEGASTEAERDAFFTKAQQLATAHSIELAVARAAHAGTETPAVPTFEQVQLGHRGQQSNVRFVELMLAVARANDLRCAIRRDNTGVTLYGFRTDIDVTKTLYCTLVLQMVADADAYIRSGAHRPVHGRTARAAFYAGWTERIGQRLQRAQQTAQVEYAHDEPAAGTAALALASKAVELNDYFAAMRRQHQVRGSWRGSSATGDQRSRVRGHAAAERARLGGEKSLPA